MNAREDKMNNSLGLQIGKASLNYCVPILLEGPDEKIFCAM